MRFAASEPITNFLKRKENYANLAGQAARERAEENAAIHEAEGLVKRTDIAGDAAIKSAKLTGAATAYAGQQRGNAAMFGGAMRGLTQVGLGGVERYKMGQRYAYTDPVGSPTIFQPGEFPAPPPVPGTNF